MKCFRGFLNPFLLVVHSTVHIDISRVLVLLAASIGVCMRVVLLSLTLSPVILLEDSGEGYNFTTTE